MDLSNYSSQSHVAQQSRRAKLRALQSTQQFENYPSNLDQLNTIHSQTPNIRYSNISYDPSLISSDMLNFATVPQGLPKVFSDQQNYITWRNCALVDSNMGEVTVGIQGNQNIYDVNEGSESVTKAYDLCFPFYSKPSFDGYQVANCSTFINPCTEVSSQNCQKHCDETHFSPLQIYQNILPLNNTICTDPVAHGLSLSLSPLTQHKTLSCHLPDGLVYSIENVKSEILGSKLKFSGASNSKVSGNKGPLGPFTGYATILKSSKFLGPAQQLLDDACAINDKCDALYKISDQVNDSADDVDAIDESRVSSPRCYNSKGNNEEAGVRTRVVESFRPEYQQKKAKLLFMQEEVCRRHKQYHQQIEMAVSLFELVSGLSESTPYISLAVKAVLRHFRSLKNKISDQLKHICKALGENFSSPVGDASTSNTSPSRLKLIDQKFRKDKTSGGNLDFSEPQQQHAWRPQRGLPERAVAVLRAWLFEHFLHPYPTDTDKHMLASQTGLSRNQVSNWFINARVRLWKPMVEEIHMLETKVNAIPDSNTENDIIKINHPDHSANLQTNSSSTLVEDHNNGNEWNRAIEKRSRTNYQIPTSTFMSYKQSGVGVETGGIGPVSLTLGLRQSPEEIGPPKQRYQQQEHHQGYFGGYIVHDFVG